MKKQAVPKSGSKPRARWHSGECSGALEATSTKKKREAKSPCWTDLVFDIAYRFRGSCLKLFKSFPPSMEASTTPTYSTIAPPNKQRHFLPKLSWLLDCRKYAMEKLSSKVFVCTGLSTGGRWGGQGRRTSGDTACQLVSKPAIS